MLGDITPLEEGRLPACRTPEHRLPLKRRRKGHLQAEQEYRKAQCPGADAVVKRRRMR